MLALEDYRHRLLCWCVTAPHAAKGSRPRAARDSRRSCEDAAMATPDVRVRLSAEGVAEVVAALKKVQAESEKAAAKQSRGFLGLNRVLGSTSSLLERPRGGPRRAPVPAAGSTSSVDAADQIQKLGQKVGASTENLSALHLVARTSASSLEEMGAALAKPEQVHRRRRPRGTRRRSPRCATWGSRSGTSRARTRSRSFELIAKRISAMPSPIQKTKAAHGHLRAVGREPHPDHERPGRGGPGAGDRPGPGAGGPDRHEAGRVGPADERRLRAAEGPVRGPRHPARRRPRPAALPGAPDHERGPQADHRRLGVRSGRASGS